MIRFVITIKKSYTESKFTFSEWQEAADFAGTAVIHGDDDIVVKLSKFDPDAKKEDDDE